MPQDNMSPQTAAAPSLEKYLVNVRFSLPFFSKPIFFVFLMGHDHRALNELSSQAPVNRRYKSPAAVVFVFMTGLLWAIASVSVFALIILYLGKSYAGIDLVQGSSPLQEFFARIGLCHPI